MTKILPCFHFILYFQRFVYNKNKILKEKRILLFPIRRKQRIWGLSEEVGVFSFVPLVFFHFMYLLASESMSLFCMSSVFSGCFSLIKI